MPIAACGMAGVNQMQSLTLPWPSKDLSPNARVHWTRRSKAVKHNESQRKDRIAASEGL
ncbi:hypothetical protein XFHB_07055 [Xylella fastidiosa]|uniref:Uncharacterized protein n=1 Tax=Xylella fastidiosa TaxID=2371 RepID=A0ABC8AE67_XYLFS|nr:hypothetical protein [Xylella fastidiosa]ALR06638.2 hypothetical protein XFHB_07055 [Xylella fastidiosa]